MGLINTIGLKLFTLIFMFCMLNKQTSCTHLPLFQSTEVNINLPKHIGNILSNVPGLVSILRATDKRPYSPQETIVQHSFGHHPANQNVQPQQYTTQNNQYMPSHTNKQPVYSYPQPYYYPPPLGYYGHDFNSPTVALTSPMPRQYWDQQYHTRPRLPQFYNMPVNSQQYPAQPQIPHFYNGPFYPNVDSQQYPTEPQTHQAYNRPVVPSVDQNSYFNGWDQTTEMPTKATIVDPTSGTSIPYREKPKGVVTPDSAFYVHIPEEPTISGIEPRR